MTLRSELIGTGTPTEQSKAICGLRKAGLTAAGSTKADATPLPSTHNEITTVPASTGVILRADLNPGESQCVYNRSGANLKVYPPAGGSINEGTADAAITLASHKMAEFFCIEAGAASIFYYVISG